MSEEYERTHWRVHLTDGNVEDFLARQAWVTDAGALNVGTPRPEDVDKSMSWLMDAIYAPGVWRMVTRVVKDTDG